MAKVEFGFGYLVKDYPEHSNDFYEIHYIYKGKGVLIGPGFQYPLLEDKLIISPPGESHSIKVSGELGFHVIRILDSKADTENLNKVCEKCFELKGFTLSKPRKFEIERLKILSTIDGVHGMESTWYGLYSILLEQLLPKTKFLAPFSQDLLTEIIRYMDNNLHKKMKIEDFSDFFSIPPTKLTKLFNSRTGISPMDYFIRLKIDAACYLLKSGDFLNKEIAQNLGFSDEFHFSKAFKRKTGLSPREYREQNKN
ncbi:MAG: helix-turn-helix transcriptional regulator [Spirochaetales bacterium]|nr:helix-turn-helix transcriptional regulator [Spirochaetales bacterium]